MFENDVPATASCFGFPLQTGVRGPSPPSSSRPGRVGRQAWLCGLGQVSLLLWALAWQEVFPELPGVRWQYLLPGPGELSANWPHVFKMQFELLLPLAFALLTSSQRCPPPGFTLAVPNTCSSVSLQGSAQRSSQKAFLVPPPD